MSEYYSRNYDELFPDERLTEADNIKQGQNVMLRLLKIFHKTCQELGLTYWLCGGTLIGAIRHEGFIPWDDDVDVFMPRDHYEEFIERAPFFLPYDVFLQTDRTVMRLVDRFGSRKQETGSDFIAMDIFPARRFPLGRKLLREVRMVIPPYPLPGVPAELPLELRLRRRAIRWAAIFIRYTGIGFLIAQGCKLGPRRYWSYDLEVTWRFYYRDDWIFPLHLHKFEDSEFFVPAEWHNVLTHQFGAYMTPPPENERYQHGFETFEVTIPVDSPEALKWDSQKR
jgi:lipopolysaccharide cholinephosphotransferase